MSLSWIILVVLASLVALVVVSFVVEALRHAPQPPRKLVWAPDIPAQYVDIGRRKLWASDLPRTSMFCWPSVEILLCEPRSVVQTMQSHSLVDLIQNRD